MMEVTPCSGLCDEWREGITQAFRYEKIHIIILTVL